jgi:hypothetical protein
VLLREEEYEVVAAGAVVVEVVVCAWADLAAVV